MIKELLNLTEAAVQLRDVNLRDHFFFSSWDPQANTFGAFITKLIMPAFTVAGVLLVLYFLWGTLKFLLSGGDKAAVAGARDMIVHAIIGFVLLIILFIVFVFIPQFFFSPTDTGIIKTP